jgi:hypothetical protein
MAALRRRRRRTHLDMVGFLGRLGPTGHLDGVLEAFEIDVSCWNSVLSEWRIVDRSKPAP